MPYFEHKDLHDSKIRKIISEYKCLYLLKCHSKIHLSLSRSNQVNPERRIQFLQNPKNSKDLGSNPKEGKNKPLFFLTLTAKRDGNPKEIPNKMINNFCNGPNPHPKNPVHSSSTSEITVVVSKGSSVV